MPDLEIARGARLERRPGRPKQKIRPGQPKQEIIRKKPLKRFRGVPEPLQFDITKLPAESYLSVAEIAAAFRRSIASVNHWRRHKMQPIEWHYVAGRLYGTVGSVRAILKGEEKA